MGSGTSQVQKSTCFVVPYLNWRDHINVLFGVNAWKSFHWDLYHYILYILHLSLNILSTIYTWWNCIYMYYGRTSVMKEVVSSRQCYALPYDTTSISLISPQEMTKSFPLVSCYSPTWIYSSSNHHHVTTNIQKMSHLLYCHILLYLHNTQSIFSM